MSVHIGAFETAAIVVAAAALAGYLNHLTFKLPQTIALTLTGAAASAMVAIADLLVPEARLSQTIQSFLSNIDFKTALLNVMLSFLLFAGALHIDLHQMRKGKWLIAVLSTLGVVVSTLVVAGGFKALSALFGIDIPFMWCLVFGALISPTDPVAVIALLQNSAAPRLLKTTVAAESLFNDGIGVVVFTILLGAATTGTMIGPLQGLEMFAVEAFGGAALGLGLGLIGYWTMRSIEDYVTEALITVALVMGGYAIAVPLGVSGPVAMAVAGLVIGNYAVTDAMTEITRQHLLGFWDLIDHILNAALFLLIGLQGIALLGRPDLYLIGLAAVPLVLIARAISVGPPLILWRNLVSFGQAFPLLTWGGLRGGICIAMALSLPPSSIRDVVLVATYVVVMFSVIVQGVTIERLIKRTLPAAREEPQLAP
ncbi:MAG TPA: sodium:proton antiporter [Caulobacteraceae bacterium]|jgi:CPA1 family monovalent cation:H+ antiporter|nr:sodium:proton antiporter [Caulobacteraceae bacterium]